MKRRLLGAATGMVVVTPPVAGQARQQDASAAGDAQLPPTSSSGLRLHRVRLSTGVVLEVAESGPVAGRPLLLLHGYPDSWFSYSPVLDRLPAGVRAIVPSQRGYGESERPPCCYRIADFARDAVALLDALGIAQADIVGHSMGSFVAQRIAIDHPDRVRRLVLIGSAAAVASRPLVEFNEVVQQLSDPIATSLVRDFQASTAQQPLPPAFFDGLVRESSKAPARVWRETLAELLIGGAEDELPRVEVSTLVVWGEHDGLYARADQDALLRALPRARLSAYPDAGHSPHWEEPDRFVADLLRFLGYGAP